MLRLEKPSLFFGAIAAALLVVALGLGIPLVIEFEQTGLVPRFPTAILVMGLVIISALNVLCGLILDTVVRGRFELRRLAYLALSAPRGADWNERDGTAR